MNFLELVFTEEDWATRGGGLPHRFEVNKNRSRALVVLSQAPAAVQTSREILNRYAPGSSGSSGQGRQLFPKSCCDPWMRTCTLQLLLCNSEKLGGLIGICGERITSF
jgi:hypothetical protein